MEEGSARRGQDASQTEAAVSGCSVTLGSAGLVGQSKEMSWASLPCTCSPCAGGCGAPGGGCWGGPPAGAIWGREAIGAPPRPSSPLLAALEHPTPALSLSPPAQGATPPPSLGLSWALSFTAQQGPPLESRQLSFTSRWFAPPGRCVHSGSVGRVAFPAGLPIFPGQRPAQGSPAGTWAAAPRCRAAAGAAATRPGWGGRS